MLACLGREHGSRTSAPRTQRFEVARVDDGGSVVRSGRRSRSGNRLRSAIVRGGGSSPPRGSAIASYEAAVTRATAAREPRRIRLGRARGALDRRRASRRSVPRARRAGVRGRGRIVELEESVLETDGRSRDGEEVAGELARSVEASRRGSKRRRSRPVDAAWEGSGEPRGGQREERERRTSDAGDRRAASRSQGGYVKAERGRTQPGARWRSPKRSPRPRGAVDQTRRG